LEGTRGTLALGLQVMSARQNEVGEEGTWDRRNRSSIKLLDLKAGDKKNLSNYHTEK
jgi:hypothetical protein